LLHGLLKASQVNNPDKAQWARGIGEKETGMPRGRSTFFHIGRYTAVSPFGKPLGEPIARPGVMPLPGFLACPATYSILA
jgi:hypothetical protein